MNRSVFGIISATCLSSLVAQSSDPSTLPPPQMVTLFAPNYTFSISFAGQALQPFSNNTDYAAEALPFNYGNAQPAVSPSWRIKEISQDFHFGFDLGIAGIVKETNAGIFINWQRFHSPNDKNSYTVPITQDMIGPFFEIGPDASDYKKATGKVHYHFDEVSADYGTFLHIGKGLHMNLFAGVSYANIFQYRFTTFSDLAGAVKRTISVPSKFWGAGPQLGFNFGYSIWKGFQFIGDAKASLFVGTFNNHTNYSTTSSTLTTLHDENPNKQDTKVHKKGGMVPGFEGKLGLAYETFWKNCMFAIEAGYQAQIYLNAIRSVDLGSEVTLGSAGAVGSADVGVYARTFQRTVSDFGLAGPYGKISFGF